MLDNVAREIPLLYPHTVLDHLNNSSKVWVVVSNEMPPIDKSYEYSRSTAISAIFMILRIIQNTSVSCTIRSHKLD